MPTIEVSLKTLEKLTGIKTQHMEFEKAKCEVDEIKGDQIKIEVSDTNRPDLWSVEGIARVMREKNGIPKIKILRPRHKIIADISIKEIRPFVAGFAAKKMKIDEPLLKDIIQMQEKLAENFGRKRQRISVGVYNYDKINFPVHYKALERSIKFVPLESKNSMTLEEVLEKHQKGVEYGYIIKHHKLYPTLSDSKQEMLSFPPIINSNYLGRVEPGMKNIFIEITGTDLDSVMLACSVFAQAMYERGAEIESVIVEYAWQTKLGKKVTTPSVKTEKISFDKSYIKSVLGVELDDKTIMKLLRSMQYECKIKAASLTVTIPHYRNDVMHPADVVEDIAITYGYNNLKPMDMKELTIGRLDKKTEFFTRCREVIAGLGYQEIMSAVLSDKDSLSIKMALDSNNVIEIDNPMTKNYSAVRNSIMPSLMLCLSKNLHVDYPQKIFELGDCAYIYNEDCVTENKLGVAISGTGVGYENISSAVISFLNSLGIIYEIKHANNTSFIKGRCADIYSGGKCIGVMGEVHPIVLNQWSLEKPIAAAEINADAIFDILGGKNDS